MFWIIIYYSSSTIRQSKSTDTAGTTHGPCPSPAVSGTAVGLQRGRSEGAKFWDLDSPVRFNFSKRFWQQEVGQLLWLMLARFFLGTWAVRQGSTFQKDFDNTKLDNCVVLWTELWSLVVCVKSQNDRPNRIDCIFCPRCTCANRTVQCLAAIHFHPDRCGSSANQTFSWEFENYILIPEKITRLRN